MESLRGLRIGIDANFWLRTISGLKDPFAEPLGGCSPGMFGVIAQALDFLGKWDIHPVFVFDGIMLTVQNEMFYKNPQVLADNDRGWVLASQGQMELSLHAFAQGTSRINADTTHFVFQYLRSRGYDCLIAPYMSNAQLSQMAHSEQIQAVFSQPGILVFGVRRVIFEWNATEARFADSEHIINCLCINRAQFLDACLLAGTDFCMTHPFLHAGSADGRSINFYQAVELARMAPLGYHVQMIPDEAQKAEYSRTYALTKTLVIHCPVLKGAHGNLFVEPLNPNDVPSDLSELVGNRLPSFLYGLLSAGLLFSKYPQTLSCGDWSENRPPLVDSLEYRALLVDLGEYRRKALSSIADGFPGLIPKGKKMNFSSFWEEKPRSISLKSSLSLNWIGFSKSDLAIEMKRQGVDNVDIRFCLRWHAREVDIGGGPLLSALAGEANNANKEDTTWLAAQAIFSFLESLDFFAEDGGMTVLGDILKDTPAVFQEPTLLALELMKFGLLTGEPLEAPADRPFPVDINYPADSSSNAVTLITRVLSLIPMRFKAELWTSALDFDLAGYHYIVRAISRSLSGLVECSLAHLLISDPKRSKLIPNHVFSPSGPLPSEEPKNEGVGPVSLLPSFMLSKNCLGIVAKFFLVDYKGNM